MKIVFKKFGFLKKKKVILPLVAVLALSSYGVYTYVFSAVVSWDGGGTDELCGGAGTANNWSCGYNWGGDVAPTSADIATFDNTSDKDATIDSAINVAGIDINSGYDGTITQNAAITVGTSNFDQAAGTFLGGSDTMTITGSYALSGGDFTSTSGNMTISASLNLSGGNFTHNGGTVSFVGASATSISCSGTPFNLVQFNKNGRGGITTINAGCTVPVGSGQTSTFAGTYIGFTPSTVLNNYGTIVAGDGWGVTKTDECGAIWWINNYDTGVISIGSGTFTVGGCIGNIYNYGTIDHDGTGWTGGGIVNEDADASVGYAGTDLSLKSDLIVDLGSFPNGKNVTFTSGVNGTLNCGDVTLGDMIVDKVSNSLSLGSSCSVGNMTSSSGTINNPASAYTIYATGDVALSSSGTLGGSNLTLELSGTNAQSLSQSAGTFASNLRINKTGSNAAMLATNFTTTQNCNVTEGLLSLDGHNLVCGIAFTVENGGTLSLVGSEFATEPTLNSGSTVVYKGDGDASTDTYILKDWSYHNLTVDMSDASDELATMKADTLSEGLVGYWSFDDGSGITVTDSTAYANHGQAQNTDDTNWDGVDKAPLDFTNGYSLTLNGSSQYVSVASSADLPTGDFTYSAWVKLVTINDEMIIMVPNSSGQNEFYFHSNSTLRTATNNSERAASSSNLPTAAWTHVLVKRSGGSITQYINGVQSGTGTDAGILAFTSCPLYFGTDVDSGCSGSLGNYLNGKMDEIRIYNRALDSLEIATLADGDNTTGVNITNLIVGGTLDIVSGTFDQGAGGSLTAGAVTVGENGTWTNTGLGDITLGGNVLNDGNIVLSRTGESCGEADDIFITSSSAGVQRAWSGSGTFDISDVTVQDQGGTANIIAYSSTELTNVGDNWVIDNDCTPGLPDPEPDPPDPEGTTELRFEGMLLEGINID